jgi:hypothetical protein
MSSMTMDHADAIDAHLHEWGDPIVDAVIFGDLNGGAIANMIDTFCRAHLDAGVRAARFVFTSVGSARARTR